MSLSRILVIQTAFIGDVVLATPIIEKLHHRYPEARLDFLLRKGNEGLLKEHPKLHHVWIWDKKKGKIRNLWRLLKRIRKERYDLVVNLQRFGATGLLTALSKGTYRVGFKKNPFSFAFSHRMPHSIGDGTHEVERNLSLIAPWTESSFERPKLYPSVSSKQKVAPLTETPFITIAPTSVWFTKQFPSSQWVKFLNQLSFDGVIYLLGAPTDHRACQTILEQTSNKQVINLCGELSLMDSVALMSQSKHNYVNDSAPLHFSSAVDAPTTAVFCSTLPRFGFGPLAKDARVVELKEPLYCRPCGLHGKKRCPEGHFRCAMDIDIQSLNP